jgi:hypothetical protein
MFILLVLAVLEEGATALAVKVIVVPPPPPLGDVSRLLNTTDHIVYIVGVGNNLFSPVRGMTRAEVAEVFFRLLINQDVETTRRFPDEPLDAWHSRAVHALASLGIIAGYEDGNFHPSAGITRAEFVTIAVRFTQGLTEDMQEDIHFNDVRDGHWASNYISAAVQFGWIFGYGDGTFRPNQQISRAEVVTIVNRMLNRVPDREFIDNHPNLINYLDVPKTHWAYYDIIEASNAHLYERYDDGGEHWME